MGDDNDVMSILSWTRPRATHTHSMCFAELGACELALIIIHNDELHLTVNERSFNTPPPPRSPRSLPSGIPRAALHCINKKTLAILRSMLSKREKNKVKERHYLQHT